MGNIFWKKKILKSFFLDFRSDSELDSDPYGSKTDPQHCFQINFYYTHYSYFPDDLFTSISLNFYDPLQVMC